MNPDAIYSNQIELKDRSAGISLTQPFSSIARLHAHLRNAYHVEQEAKRLYAMSNVELNEMGMSRDDIPAHLANLL